MDFTKKQTEFLTAVEMGRNIYLSGFAGTGKSTIAVEAMSRLTQAKRKFVAIAPTGRAANNINGQTAHSFFRINPYGCNISFDDCNFVNKGILQVMKKAETFFLDEASMFRADIIDCMHMTMIKNGLSNGMKGKQIIFIGDLGQLPPIASDNERSILMKKYEGITFLDAEITKQLQLQHIDLNEIVRQNDREFIDALSIVRAGGKAPYFRQFVNKEPSGVILAPTNSIVNAYNEEGLQKQEGEVLTFNSEIDGNLKPEDYSLESQIRVKNGCKIMYLVNSKDNPLRNGTIGEFNSRLDVKNYEDGNNKEELKLFFRIGKTEWPIEKYTAHKKEYVYDSKADELKLVDKGSITQYPFKLAYAMTIHKSQGMTFDDMTIDFRQGCFQKEQYYVALSRATGPKALRIIL